MTLPDPLATVALSTAQRRLSDWNGHIEPSSLNPTSAFVDIEGFQHQQQRITDFGSATAARDSEITLATQFVHSAARSSVAAYAQRSPPTVLEPPGAKALGKADEDQDFASAV